MITIHIKIKKGADTKTFKKLERYCSEIHDSIIKNANEFIRILKIPPVADVKGIVNDITDIIAPHKDSFEIIYPRSNWREIKLNVKNCPNKEYNLRKDAELKKYICGVRLNDDEDFLANYTFSPTQREGDFVTIYVTP